MLVLEAHEAHEAHVHKSPASRVRPLGPSRTGRSDGHPADGSDAGPRASGTDRASGTPKLGCARTNRTIGCSYLAQAGHHRHVGECVIPVSCLGRRRNDGLWTHRRGTHRGRTLERAGRGPRASSRAAGDSQHCAPRPMGQGRGGWRHPITLNDRARCAGAACWREAIPERPFVAFGQDCEPGSQNDK